MDATPADQPVAIARQNHSRVATRTREPMRLARSSSSALAAVEPRAALTDPER
jgi:hypothetical protein